MECGRVSGGETERSKTRQEEDVRREDIAMKETKTREMEEAEYII